MKYDVIVIGGGPAGMMAAGRAAENGAKVLLLEKKRSLGNKLLITGNGRCNITNDINDHRVFAERLGSSGKFMLSALARFGVSETLEFFHSHSVPTVVEEYGKIFPESSSARDVLDALLLYLEDFKVEIITDSEVISFVKDGSRLDRVVLKDGQEFEADKFIVAAGGKSYPLTGSTGDVYRLIGSLGHHIVEPRPVLSGIMVNEPLVKNMEGASLDDVELSLYIDDKKVGSERGEVIFTGVGVSGPAAIDFSRLVDEYSDSKAKINIDMVPSIDFSSLDVKLEKELQEELGRMIKNYLSDLVPPKVIPTILSLAKIEEERRCGEVTRDERRVIIHALKEVKLTFKSFGGFDRAMVTRGGIDLKEVDSKTMRSKIIDNLYFAGEILDLDGPTGGFNLQIAWSTGFAAGERV